MTLYRKRPVEVEAIRNTGEWSVIIAWLNNIGADRVPFGGRPPITRHPDGSLRIDTPEGVMAANVGDWIIRGIRGEFYPCKSDIFAATYEPVEVSA